MKINSELKVDQVLLLIKGLDVFINNLTNDYAAASRKAKRIMFFFPWRKRRLSLEALTAGGFVLQAINDASELRELLLESTGVDMDMRPVTLREMLTKPEFTREAK